MILIVIPIGCTKIFAQKIRNLLCTTINMILTIISSTRVCLYHCLLINVLIANESPNLSLKSPSVIIDAPKISPGSVWNCLELCGHYSDFPACLPSDLQSFKRPSHSIALSKAHIQLSVFVKQLFIGQLKMLNRKFIQHSNCPTIIHTFFETVQKIPNTYFKLHSNIAQKIVLPVVSFFYSFVCPLSLTMMLHQVVAPCFQIFFNFILQIVKLFFLHGLS